MGIMKKCTLLIDRGMQHRIDVRHLHVPPLRSSKIHQKKTDGPMVPRMAFQRVGVSPGKGVMQARVPKSEVVEDLMGKLDISEIKKRLEILFANMRRREKIPPDTDVNSFFVLGGDGKYHFESVKYKELFKESSEDKDKIYFNPADAQTAFKGTELEKLKNVFDNAKIVVGNTLSDKGKIEKVFRSKKEDACNNYTEIDKKIGEFKLQADNATKIHTDYNGDDAEIGIGGYANFVNQYVHFNRMVANDTSGAKTIVIHEFAHLSRASIRDFGYVGSPGFDSMEDDVKVNNAAHYEIVPGWILGSSIYGAVRDFIPMSEKTTGKAETVPSVKVDAKTAGKRKASEFLRKAWAKALNIVSRLRFYNMNPSEMKDRALSVCLDISEKLGLTVHLKKSNEEVTVLDIVLMEDMGHSIAEWMTILPKMEYPDMESGSELPTDDHVYYDYFLKELLRNNIRGGMNLEKLEYLQGCDLP